jgi:hypothetical protein
MGKNTKYDFSKRITGHYSEDEDQSLPGDSMLEV